MGIVIYPIFMQFDQTNRFIKHALGIKLKNVPKGYDNENLMADYLKNKSWFLEHHIEDSVLLKPNEFIKIAGNVFHLMVPFNNYLNCALDGFVMPKRG